MNGPKSGWRGGALCAAAVLCLGASCLAQEEGETVVEPARTELVGGTSDDASIPVEHLRVRLRPLAREQLEAEAESWFELLQAKIAEVGEVELEIQALDDADQAGPEAEALRDQLVELRTAESDLIARLQIVATALKEKGGDVTAVEQYLAAVSDLKNSADTSSRLAALTAAARSWVRSPEGGLLFGKRIALALVILLIFWIISRYAGRLVGKGLESRPEISNLLTNFAKRMAGGVTLVIGILMALAALGVSIGPLMAALGAGGFIVGFALQETLASFASGMMIMIYRPFDVDDYVQVAGVEGNVKQMSLVSTTLLTLDNKELIIPNKTVWGDTITNYTARKIRRVDLVFGIGYGDDIPQAMKVLNEVAGSHELVLEKPGVSVEVVELADSSVNIALRPWVKTGDYWPVFWGLTREVKMRFDQEGISIPFPQRDVHMIAE